MTASSFGKVFIVILVIFCADAVVAPSAKAQGVAAVNAGITPVTGVTGVAGATETTLTRSEAKKLDRILCKCFTSHKHMYPLQRYNRQYFAFTNANGEKEVIVSCRYKRTDTKLGEASLPAAEGKEAYFRATINLHTMQAQEFGFRENSGGAQQDVSLQ